MRVPDHLIEQVRASVNTVDFIGQYVKLKSVGKDKYGKCPFCDGKKFSVSPKEGLFYCFNCGAGGDVIELLQRTGTEPLMKP
ncbi:MAG: hypothetical protein IID42_10440 [Planctomycetes bacterium]|nr:hypothetical protein [Planctomycetota bacterium]